MCGGFCLCPSWKGLCSAVHPLSSTFKRPQFTSAIKVEFILIPMKLALFGKETFAGGLCKGGPLYVVFCPCIYIDFPFTVK